MGEAEGGNRLFDLTQNHVGIARANGAVGAIDQEVEVFHDDGADEGGVAVGLETGVVDAVAAEQGQVDFSHDVFFAAPAVGVANADFADSGQAKLVRDRGRQHETRCTAVNDAFDFGSPNCGRGNRTLSGLENVRVIREFDFHLKSPQQ